MHVSVIKKLIEILRLPEYRTVFNAILHLMVGLKLTIFIELHMSRYLQNSIFSVSVILTCMLLQHAFSEDVLDVIGLQHCNKSACCPLTVARLCTI